MCSTLMGDRTQSQCEGYKDAQENRLNGVAIGVDRNSSSGVRDLMQDSKRMHNSCEMNAMEAELDMLAIAGFMK